MAPHSSTLASKIPWMEEPGGLQSMGSPRVGHNWATLLSPFTSMHWRRKWQPTPAFLPGESHGQRSLVGYSPWGHQESDTTEWLTLPLLLTTLYRPGLPLEFASLYQSRVRLDHWKAFKNDWKQHYFPCISQKPYLHNCIKWLRTDLTHENRQQMALKCDGEGKCIREITCKS